MSLVDAAISSDRRASDLGGSITVTADSVEISNGSISSLPSSGGGGFYGRYIYVNYGGNISVSSGRLILQDGASIETSTTGYDYAGAVLSGDNVTISPDGVVLGQNGAIRATANDGDGGAISITTEALFRTGGAAVDASSTLGLEGPVVIDGLENPNTAETADLAAGFLDEGAILRNSCLATAALAMAADLDQFAQTFAGESDGPQGAGEGAGFGQMRIGVHAGDALLGNFGGENFFGYTAIGDTVNVAARLVNANNAFGTRTCFSAATAQAPTSTPAPSTACF